MPNEVLDQAESLDLAVGVYAAAGAVPPDLEPEFLLPVAQDVGLKVEEPARIGDAVVSLYQESSFRGARASRRRSDRRASLPR